MSLGIMRRLAASAVVLSVLAGSAGAAVACHHPGTTSATQLSSTTFHHEWMGHGFGLGNAVTTYLGLSRTTIKADLAAGQTLAQIANATPGKSAAGLVGAIMTAFKTKLDAAVGAGKLASTTESTILAHLNTSVTAVVNGQLRRWWPFHRRGEHL